MTKIVVDDERYFPTLGIIAMPGDEVDVPDEAFPAVVDSVQPKSKKEVISDGSAPQ